MAKILLVFGTRPEAIKMCPLASELKMRPGTEVRICVTGQHREMLHPVLAAFGISADHDLSLMQAEQSLPELTSALLSSLDRVLAAEQPDIILVHGDTTTAFAAALAAFYRRIPVGHVEAGLRTHDLDAPYPEEFNRRTVDILSHLHFAPTEHARENLLREGCDPETVFVTGNTVIDALKATICPEFTHPLLDWVGERRLILLTAHRRENLGTPMEAMFRAICRAADDYEDACVLFPVHMNPVVRKTAEAILGGHDQICLTEPLEVTEFHNILSRCHIVLTDSGGIQEEATALGKPVLVMRDITERPEGLDTGTLSLAGTEEAPLYEKICHLLTDRETYEKMCVPSPIYGDGHACRCIADILCDCKLDLRRKDFGGRTSP